MPKINVNNKIWDYKVGQTVCVVKGENGLSHKVSLATLTGLTWPEIEKKQAEKTFSVTPKQVADWITNSFNEHGGDKS